MNLMRSIFAVVGFISACLAPVAGAGKPAAWQLPAEVQVDSRGVFAADVLSGAQSASVPRVQIAPAPAMGKFLVLTRAQINEALAKAAPQLVTTNWSGAERVRITRRVRSLEETELKELLMATLQKEEVRDKGELELRFMRAWAPVLVPDEPLTIKVLDLPVAGVTASFIARFELRAGSELAGSWQINLQARIMREVWVARSSLVRGMPLRDADLTKERRDVLVLRDTVAALPKDDYAVEIGENIPAGAPLGSRSLRLRPIVLRGKVVDALVLEGGLTISTKVEVLEDGLPGQTVRVRNLKSKKEFRGKVHNEETILVTL
jgi:flagella basal body P-ring formation protein FlgA